MSNSVLFGQVRAEFADLDRRMIRSELAEAGDKNDVEIESADLSGTSTYSFFNIEYDWSIDANPDKGVFVATEKTYISRSWLTLFLFAVYALSFAYGAMWIGAMNDGFGAMPQVLESVFFGLSVLGFAVTILPITSYPGVLANTRGASEGYRKYTVFDAPFVILGLCVMVSVLGSFFNRPHVNLALVFITVYIATIIRRKPDKLVELSESLPERNLLFQLPPVVGEYLVVSIFLTGFSLILLLIARSLIDTSIANWVAAVVFISLLVIGWWIFDQLSGEGALDAFFNIVQKEGWQIGTAGRYSYLGIVIFTSIANVSVLSAVVASVAGISVYGRPLGSALPLSIRLLLLFVSALLAYFPAGLLFQTWMFLKENITILRQSDKLELDLDVESIVLEPSNDRHGPASLSTGFNNYILLPRSVLNELDSDEVKAVVAHEQRHIQNRDALLAFYTPVIGLFLMTGQNVFYSLLDFREREFEADDYAVKEIGDREPVIQAIDKLGATNADRQPANLLERYFGLFYGTFALSKVHPTPAERKERISD